MTNFYSIRPLLSSGVLLFAFSPLLQAQIGSESHPMSVAERIAKTDNSSTTYWVSGYVVGEYENYSNNKHFYQVAPPFNGTTAYLLADSKDEIDINKCITVQLTGTAFNEDIDLNINPEHWKKKMSVCGLLRSYMTRPGMTSIKAHYFDKNQTFDNEVGFWNFYESFDNKGYVAQSAGSVFAGGTYSGENGQWYIQGGTWGDSGNDNKWGRASIRLRLSEGSTGEKGSLELISDKENGLGEVRFWAGNYQEDAAKTLALTLQYSTDKGENWHNVASDIPVKRGNNVTTNGMSEYRFEVNMPGQIRVKFTKADNTSGGINIDNIRLSDYRNTTPLSNLKEEQSIACGIREGILFLTDQTEGIQIYTSAGQLVRNLSAIRKAETISLPAGIYLLRNRVQTQRIVVGF